MLPSQQMLQQSIQMEASPLFLPLWAASTIEANSGNKQSTPPSGKLYSEHWWPETNKQAINPCCNCQDTIGQV